MSQKLTLARYLEGRGSVKSLTRIEAEAFGVPYPLISGWPARYGDTEITPAMLEDLAQRIASARRSTASKALRGLDGAGRVPDPVAGECSTESSPSRQSIPAAHSMAVSHFPGFALRLARRRPLHSINPTRASSLITSPLSKVLS